MSAIYTYGQWIDIVDRGTSGDQVMDILASWKVNAYKLLEDNHKLESRIAELEAERRWIPVGERLPEDGESVLIAVDSAFAPYCHVYEAFHHSAATQWATANGLYFHGVEYARVTHWMPLPEPPEVKE